MSALKFKVRDYSRYFLKGNPFPYVSIPEERPAVYADQERALARLSDVVFTSLATGRSSHAVVVGPHGSGKSHTLKYLRHAIVEAAEGAGRRVVTCYIPSPGRDYLHMHRSFMQELGAERVAGLAERHPAEGVPRDVRRALEALRDEKRHVEAWRWLIGERLSPRDLERLGLSRSVDAVMALTIFRWVHSMLRADGYGLVCLLCDEMERINQLHVTRRQEMYNMLRHLVDWNPRGLCLVFACTPAGWDEVYKYSIALARRLSRNVVYLEPVTEPVVREVIAAHVGSQRAEDRGILRRLGLRGGLVEHLRRRGLSAEEAERAAEIYPFTEDAVARIARAAHGNIGEVLKYCNLAVDHGLDTGKEVLDAKAVEDVLAEAGR